MYIYTYIIYSYCINVHTAYLITKGSAVVRQMSYTKILLNLGKFPS